MQNKTEYEIKKLSELNCSQVEQAIALFVDGFYYIYEKAVSKGKALLQQLFIDAFDCDMVFACLHEERIVRFLGLGNSIKRCVALRKETFKRLLGKFKGTMIYLQMGGMLLLHGNGENHKIFDKAIPLLSEHFNVYAIDSRGHGQSDAVSEYHYDDMAEDVKCFIDKLKLKNPILYGFSDGGIIGVLLAAKYPQLLSQIIISGTNTKPEGIRTGWLKLF